MPEGKAKEEARKNAENRFVAQKGRSFRAAESLISLTLLKMSLNDLSTMQQAIYRNLVAQSLSRNVKKEKNLLALIEKHEDAERLYKSFLQQVRALAPAPDASGGAGAAMAAGAESDSDEEVFDVRRGSGASDARNSSAAGASFSTVSPYVPIPLPVSSDTRPGGASIPEVVLPVVPEGLLEDMGTLPVAAPVAVPDETHAITEESSPASVTSSSCGLLDAILMYSSAGAGDSSEEEGTKDTEKRKLCWEY